MRNLWNVSAGEGTIIGQMPFLTLPTLCNEVFFNVTPSVNHLLNMNYWWYNNYNNSKQIVCSNVQWTLLETKEIKELIYHWIFSISQSAIYPRREHSRKQIFTLTKINPLRHLASSDRQQHGSPAIFTCLKNQVFIISRCLKVQSIWFLTKNLAFGIQKICYKKNSR